MKLKSNTSNFEEFVKDQLNSFEAPYDESAWMRLENDLPKQIPSTSICKSTLFKVAAISTLVVAVATILYFSSDKKEQIASNDNTSTANISSQPKSNISVEDKAIVAETNHETKNTITTKQNQVVVENNNLNNNSNTNNVSEKNNMLDNKVVTENKNCNKIITQKTPCSEFSCNQTEGCGSLSVQFSPKEKSDSIIYLWNFGDGKTSNDQSPSHIYSRTGNFSVSLTTKYFKTEQITVIQKDRLIKVNPLPKVNFNINNDGQEYTFKNTSVGGNTNKWIFSKDEVVLEENPTYTFNKAGTYDVQLICTNNYGCTDVMSKKITVSVKHNYFVPTAFSPNEDGNNDSFGAIGKDLENYEFEMLIYNKSGQLIFASKDINDQWTGLNKDTHQSCESGIYIWKIITKDKFNNIQNKTGNVNLQK